MINNYNCNSSVFQEASQLLEIISNMHPFFAIDGRIVTASYAKHDNPPKQTRWVSNSLFWVKKLLLVLLVVERCSGLNYQCPGLWIKHSRFKLKAKFLCTGNKVAYHNLAVQFVHFRSRNFQAYLVVIILCCWASHLPLPLLHSTQVLNGYQCWRYMQPCDVLASCPGGSRNTSTVISCYWSQR